MVVAVVVVVVVVDGSRLPNEATWQDEQQSSPDTVTCFCSFGTECNHGAGGVGVLLRGLHHHLRGTSSTSFSAVWENPRPFTTHCCIVLHVGPNCGVKVGRACSQEARFLGKSRMDA